MNINKGQITAIRTSISKLGLDKDETIAQASLGRTTSTRELTWDEAESLRRFLYSQQNVAKDKANKMRRKIISACHEMHMTLSPGVIDMAQVNAFIVKHGYLKPKELNAYTLQELPKLVTVVERIRDSYLKQRRK